MKKAASLKEFIKTNFAINIEDKKVVEIEEYFEHKYGISDVLSVIGKDFKLYNELIERVTVSETYFFRNIEHFKALGILLTKSLSSRKSIIIISAGCSSGEEPYTIAMFLKEFFPDYFKSSLIYGIDLNAKSLEKARTGIFMQGSFRNNFENYKEKYFTKIDSYHYKLDDEIMNKVNFIQGNIKIFDFEKFFKKADIIFCRNVFIYFDNNDIKKILSKFKKIMHQNSILFLGYSELINQISDDFQVELIRNTFIFQKKVDLSNELKIEKNETILKKQTVEKEEGIKDNKKDLVAIREELSRENYIKVKNLVNNYLKKYPKSIEGRILLAVTYSFYREFAQALDILNKLVLRDPEFIFIKYILMGVIYFEEGNLDDSIKYFHKALLLNPFCLICEYYLAFLYEEKRFYSVSKKYYKNVVINKNLTVDPKIRAIIPNLNENEIVTFAKQKLEKLEKEGF